MERGGAARLRLDPVRASVSRRTHRASSAPDNMAQSARDMASPSRRPSIVPHTGLGRAASGLGCLSRAVAATVIRPFHPCHSKGTNALMERSMDCSTRRAWSARKAQPAAWPRTNSEALPAAIDSSPRRSLREKDSFAWCPLGGGRRKRLRAAARPDGRSRPQWSSNHWRPLRVADDGGSSEWKAHTTDPVTAETPGLCVRAQRSSRPKALHAASRLVTALRAP